MGIDNSEPNNRDNSPNRAERTLSPEELAILNHRLATIDDAVTVEEFLKQLKDEMKRRDSQG